MQQLPPTIWGLVVVAVSSLAVETVTDSTLIGDGLVGWRMPTGEWKNVGAVSVDPNDEKRIVSTPGRGVLVNGQAGHDKNLVTVEEHGDIELHVEFMVPKGSNSGVYLQGRYEIQVLDSWGIEKPKYSDCGGIYQRWEEKTQRGYEGHAPRVNAARPPGEWQTFDVVFEAPRFDSAGTKIKNARFVMVTHNGKLIHEDVEVTGPTRAATFEREASRGPLMLQGDHGPVAYRNLKWRTLPRP
jgi:hypothetical protein